VNRNGANDETEPTFNSSRLNLLHDLPAEIRAMIWRAAFVSDEAMVASVKPTYAADEAERIRRERLSYIIVSRFPEEPGAANKPTNAP
jgi:hypothetical protein